MRPTLGSDLRVVVFESSTAPPSVVSFPPPWDQVNDWFAEKGDAFEVIDWAFGEWTNGRRCLLFLVHPLPPDGVSVRHEAEPMTRTDTAQGRPTTLEDFPVVTEALALAGVGGR